MSKFLDPALQNYNDTWDKIEKMHERILSDEFRFANPDSFGNGWIYNWFCMDHVGYEYNPRHRDMGYHNIYDRYLEILDKYGRYKDDVQFHFHPMSHYKEANRAGNHTSIPKHCIRFYPVELLIVNFSLQHSEQDV